jgi:hypothetical protein
MAEQHAPSKDRTTLAVGFIAAAFGFYLCLVGIGLVPPPSRINGPVWLAAAAGLAFLCAGVSVLVRGLLCVNDHDGELPNNAPLVLQIVYWLSGLIAAAALASIGTWVAFGGGDERVSISGPFTGPVGEGVGRAVFAVGTMLTWLMVILLARHGAKKILGAKKIFGKKD